MATELRSLKRLQEEAARLTLLASQHGITPATGKKFEADKAAVRSLWLDNCEPLAFDEYCREVAGIDLFPKQADVFDLPNLLRPSYLFSSRRTISTFWLCWGKGSGKDLFASLALTYICYVLSRFKDNPRTYFAKISGKAIAASTPLDLINVAPTEHHALNVYYAYVKQWIMQPLFRDIEIYPKVGQIKPGTDNIIFPYSNVHLYSKSSKASGVDGFNTFCSCMDECDEFRNSLGHSNADLMHNTLHRTMIGRWGSVGLEFLISYPREDEGFMLTKEKQFTRLNQRDAAEGRALRYYMDKAGTADIRPDFNILDPAIQAEFEIDSDSASAMYLCKPMAAEFAFFRIDADDMSEWVDDTRPPICEVIETFPALEGKDGQVRDHVCVELESIVRQPGCEYFITIDGGLTGDSYALCVGHVDVSSDSADWLCPFCAQGEGVLDAGDYEKLFSTEIELIDDPTVCGLCYQRPIQITPVLGNRGWYRKRPGNGKHLVIDGKTFVLPHVYEDLLIELSPRRHAQAGGRRREVFLPGMHEQVKKLAYALNVQKIRVDQWQQIETVQAIFAETGIDIDKMMFTQPDQLKRALLYKQYLNNYLFTLRPNAKRDKEVRQIQRKGSKIDHPVNGSKDCYDVESMMVWLAATYRCAGLDLMF